MTTYIQSLPNELIDKIYYDLHTLNMKELSEQIYDIQEKQCHEAICLIRYFLNTPNIGCPLHAIKNMIKIVEIVTCLFCNGYIDSNECVSYICRSQYSINCSTDNLYELLQMYCNEGRRSLKQIIDLHKDHICDALEQFEESTRWEDENVN